MILIFVNKILTILIAVFVIFSCTPLSAQSVGKHLTGNDHKFIQHLLDRKFYEENIIFLKELKNDPFLAPTAYDSINYWLGVSYYYKSEFDSSGRYIARMQEKNSFVFERSRILLAYNQMHTRQYKDAKSSIASFTFSDPVSASFANVEQAAIALLEKDTASFRKIADSFQNDHYAVARAEKALLLHYNNLKESKNKSPFVAGISSAIIPGLGKVYAGKTGQGISAFLVCAVLGAQTWETYNKSSWQNPYFFLYGGLFTAFYVGNIYGSIKLVQKNNIDNYEAIRS